MRLNHYFSNLDEESMEKRVSNANNNGELNRFCMYNYKPMLVESAKKDLKSCLNQFGEDQNLRYCDYMNNVLKDEDGKTIKNIVPPFQRILFCKTHTNGIYFMSCLENNNNENSYAYVSLDEIMACCVDRTMFSVDERIYVFNLPCVWKEFLWPLNISDEFFAISLRLMYIYLSCLQEVVDSFSPSIMNTINDFLSTTKEAGIQKELVHELVVFLDELVECIMKMNGEKIRQHVLPFDVYCMDVKRKEEIALEKQKIEQNKKEQINAFMEQIKSRRQLLKMFSDA